jgi:hypothetical protein
MSLHFLNWSSKFCFSKWFKFTDKQVKSNSLKPVKSEDWFYIMRIWTEPPLWNINSMIWRSLELKWSLNIWRLPLWITDPDFDNEPTAKTESEDDTTSFPLKIGYTQQTVISKARSPYILHSKIEDQFLIPNMLFFELKLRCIQ